VVVGVVVVVVVLVGLGVGIDAGAAALAILAAPSADDHVIAVGGDAAAGDGVAVLPDRAACGAVLADSTAAGDEAAVCLLDSAAGLGVDATAGLEVPPAHDPVVGALGDALVVGGLAVRTGYGDLAVHDVTVASDLAVDRAAAGALDHPCRRPLARTRSLPFSVAATSAVGIRLGG
jgi:hypothetical protein